MVLKSVIEEIRIQCENSSGRRISEFVANKVHEKVRSPVVATLQTARNSTAAEMMRNDSEFVSHFINGVFQRNTQAAQENVNRIRRLLRRDARERELQDALVASGLLNPHCDIFTEVSLRRCLKYRGMRLDVVVPNNQQGVCEVFELKRGTHLLISRKGRHFERLSRCFEKTIKQGSAYTSRTGEDLETQECLEKTCKVRTKEFTLTLIAGRKLKKASDYMLIQKALDSATDVERPMQFMTWDGLLNRLERIWT